MPLTSGAIIGMVVVAILLFFSAMISGSEVAYFSLGPQHILALKEQSSRKEVLVLKLLEEPERLLASILISNNFINVGIVIIASFVTGSILNFSHSPVLGFIIQVVIITFLLLLFGEIIPKVYANRFAPQFARRMAVPLVILDKAFQPLIYILVNRLRWSTGGSSRRDRTSPWTTSPKPWAWPPMWWKTKRRCWKESFVSAIWKWLRS